MAFTDRFLKLPIEILDRELQEITGNAPGEESYMKINPFEISHYRPNYEKDRPGEEITSLTMKTGDNTIVYLSISEFERLLNEHQK